MVISMLKIRRPLGRLIFNMGIAIPGKTVFLIETAPCIFILDLTIGFNRLRRDNCKTRRETIKFYDLVLLMLEILR